MSARSGAGRSIEPFEMGGYRVAPGQKLRIDLPAAVLPTQTPVNLPLTLVHGLRPGPVVWVSAALHGDELNGIEIIARVLESLTEPLRCGTLIAVPIVNVFGFLAQSRYFPDRRDLNRSFPGSARGSLAGRIAHLFMEQVVRRCSHGLDLHTGSQDRSNLPQVRGDLQHAETRRIAEAFGAPVMAHSTVRDGSLRAAATRLGIPVVVYEGGESLRFDAEAIEVGRRGVLRVLRVLGLVGGRLTRQPASVLVKRSTWVRARKGGLVRLGVGEGDVVERKQLLGTVVDPFGTEASTLRAPYRGIVIGKSNNPVAHDGDAVLHLGELQDDSASSGS